MHDPFGPRRRPSYALAVVVVGAAWLSAAGDAIAATLGGRIAFPGERPPAMTVVARDAAAGAAFTVTTRPGQTRYQLTVPAGTYEVFAVPHGFPPPEPGQAELRGAFTRYSICARDKAALEAGRCQTGPLERITVGATDTRSDVHIDDWFMPDALMAQLVLPAASAAAPASAAGASGDSLFEPRLRFATYPVDVRPVGQPAAPDFGAAPAAARRFRTQIEKGAAAGAAFAGQVAVARWSCGTRCENWALVDLASGRVVWLDHVRDQPLLHNFPCEAPPLEFRLDSRLLRTHRLDGERVVTRHYLWSGENGRLDRLAETTTPVGRFCPPSR